MHAHKTSHAVRGSSCAADSTKSIRVITCTMQRKAWTTKSISHPSAVAAAVARSAIYSSHLSLQTRIIIADQASTRATTTTRPSVTTWPLVVSRNSIHRPRSSTSLGELVINSKYLTLPTSSPLIMPISLRVSKNSPSKSRISSNQETNRCRTTWLKTER